ncbi:Similar to wnt11: Protein Wnt-11 (Danio rerio) [Cotesia congregata]|uniref:Protein Wnt n=1 Tax=Cotesia congregata TaxID=51543 RepID=A0A8J2HKU4_COTCN|nr:Similar to wnt11: Protein Wnt-11 (Danio rerio) [Cotesia congregata]
MRVIKCVKTSEVVLLLLFSLSIIQDGSCIKWLALGKTSDGRVWTRELCTSARSSGLLERKQARACRAAPDVMPSLIQAARDTSFVCQQAFRNRRWNCSSIERAPYYTPELLSGTREQAFVYAMSAAAAVWRLARGCALGNLAACSCATPPRREPPSPSALISSSSFISRSASFDAMSARNSFKWGGCGDDVRSASRMAKRFLQGSSPTGSGSTSKFLHAVNMHNNRAGRRAVEQSLTLECKCHGVSGSCSVRTCWRGLDSKGPAAAGVRLFRKYATAAEVRPKSGSRLPPLYHHDNLLYTTKSPDYCLPDKKRGSLGTVGRQCNGSSAGYEGCEYLCCGRGHVTKTREILERCECKYISCCYSVKCKTCKNIITTYECN